MRPTSFVFAPILAAFALVSCQDSYSSNSERDTHMGDIRASAPPESSGAAPAAVAVPGTPAPVNISPGAAPKQPPMPATSASH